MSQDVTWWQNTCLDCVLPEAQSLVLHNSNNNNHSNIETDFIATVTMPGLHVIFKKLILKFEM